MPTAAAPVAAIPLSEGRARRLTRLLAVAALGGAFLLFLVQPLIGKAILPWFGGAAAVWTVCMLFFQAALIVGYGGVYLLAKLSQPARRSAPVILAFAVALIFLPIVPDAAWKPSPQDWPAWRVLGLLTATLGVPYAVLAMTAPLVQTWFVRVHGGRTPYRLYALSNIGSLVALAAYPLVIEPNFDVVTQAKAWSIGFAAFAVLMEWCAWSVRHLPDPPVMEAAAPKSKRAKKEPEVPTNANWQVAIWLALSASGSVLLLVVTNYLCQDVTSVPFLWVAPLAVYLLTFILSFDRPQWYRPTVYAAAIGVFLPWILTSVSPSFEVALTQQLGLLFVGCMACHGELARRKPPPHDLARYYLLIACGGALGGIFVGLIAPTMFSRDWERPLAYCALMVFVVVAAMRWVAQFAEMGPNLRRLLTTLVAAGLCASIFLKYQTRIRSGTIAVARNFYGIVSVHGPRDREEGDYDRYRVMMSGSTLHGTEVFVPGERPVPESYYAPTSGVGRLLTELNAIPPPRRVGVIGLGVGTLAAYGQKGDVYRFYELNPAVADFAKRYFTYLSESSAACDVVLGDGRLSLEAEPPQQFDVLVLDAFTSDAIPTHLLTLEAFAVWLKHLKNGGRIALHVSNRHVDLIPVAAAAAKHYGLAGVLVENSKSVREATEASNWILLARTPEEVAMVSTESSTVTPLSQSAPLKHPWTDSFSSLLGVVR